MFSYFKDKIQDAFSSAEEEIIEEEVVEDIPEEPEALSDQPISEPEVEQNKGIFSSVTDTLTKTTLTAEKFEDIFWELELTLLENNVAQAVVDDVKQRMSDRLIDTKVSRGTLRNTMQTAFRDTMEESVVGHEIISMTEEAEDSEHYSVLVIGINGSGKTTTAAKLASLFKKEGLQPVLCAADTFRAAAIDQLQHHADSLNIPCIKHEYGSDPAAVAYDTKQYIQKNGGVGIIDTAGRLHSNKNLMNQLEKIYRVVEPDRVVYVAESLAGNDAVKQAETFSKHIPVDGIIMTKADADDKGGTILSASYITNKPVIYLGTGQEYDDLEPFDVEAILSEVFE